MDESADDHKLKKLSVGKPETGIAGSEAPDGNSTKSANEEVGLSPKKLNEAPVEVTGIESDTESPVAKDETKITKKKHSKDHREVSDAVRKRSERMKTLLVSSDILPEEDENSEEDIAEEPPPEVGTSHFKFLKKRCGILVNNKTWNAPWQCYNMLETEKSWKVIDEWAPTKQFIRYQDDLVVWRHDYPLAQHTRWDRGLLKDCRRPTFPSSWENLI